MKKEYLTILITLLLVLAVLCMPASAYYFEDLHTVKSGTVNGGVYVGGGHGSGHCPYTQNFTVPDGTIVWARLYVLVVGGGMSPEPGSGWLNLTYWNGTGNTENNQYLDFNYDGSANDETQGYYLETIWACTWKYWNVTDIARSGVNGVTAKTSEFGDGDLNGIALVVVYDDGGVEATYWINQGCIFLSPRGYPGSVSSDTTWFNGAINTSRNATLWTIIGGGNYGQTDYLYFNDNTISSNAADGGGITPDSTWGPPAGEAQRFFDIDRWDVNKTWLSSSSNNVTFQTPDDGDTTMPCTVVLISKERKQDLTVSDIDTLVERDEQVPIALVANHSYTINATVRNVGDIDATGFNVTLHENGTLRNDTYISELGAWAETVVQFNWTPGLSGVYELNVTADAYGAVNESDETNNASSKIVKVLAAAGPADLVISPDNITFLPAYGWHTANNNTLIKVKVTNNGTADAGNTSTNFKVQLIVDGVSTNKTTWLRVKSYLYVEFERDIPSGVHNVEVKLDPDSNVTESDYSNNNATKSLKIISCRILNTHHYGITSAYNGILSNYITVNMFDITKLTLENTTPVVLLESVANVTRGTVAPVDSIDGLREGIVSGEPYWWNIYVNAIPVHWDNVSAYPVREGEVVHFDIPSYIPRPVMDYPEPFLHGYNGTVWNTSVVYPDELCYQGKANAVRDKLNASGVPNERISIVSVENITDVQKNSSNLILLGTPSNNPLIADVNSQHSDVGMTVYFSGNRMIDDSDDTPYDVGGVIEACDNPYYGAEYGDTGPSVWLVTAVEDYWAYKAADLLATDTSKLNRFWTIREPYLVPTWDGTNVTLDWGNWTGNSTYDIYITNNLTAGFPMTPNATTTELSWTDVNAGDDEQRYYRVTCNATGVQIEGVICKIGHNLEKYGNKGINWITLPSTNPPLTNADKLIKAIPNHNNVKWWNSTSQLTESYSRMPWGYVGTNFDVKPSRGYEIVVTANTPWTVVGWILPICEIELKKSGAKGINWIGMPFNTTIDNADELIKAIPNHNNVKWWNSTSQLTESYSRMPWGYVGTNFDVTPARGYEVVVNANTIWTPQ